MIMLIVSSKAAVPSIPFFLSPLSTSSNRLISLFYRALLTPAVVKIKDSRTYMHYVVDETMYEALLNGEATWHNDS